MAHTIFCVDDSSMHMTRITAAVTEACRMKNISDYQVLECSDGQQLIDRIKNHRPMLITMDIHMPIMDGLSTLLRLRDSYLACPMIMVSSENERIVKRHALFNSTMQQHFNAPEEKKWEMLEKVARRVKSGVHEEGKINSVLDACSSLGMDPIAVAKRYGANAFISKPFEAADACKIIYGYLAA